MKQKGLRYDGSIDKYPITEGEVYCLDNGSKITIADITLELPEFSKKADCVFIDPAGNKGVLKAYYTKAEKECPAQSFDEFVTHIKKCIEQIKPDRLFVECFARNKTQIIKMVESLFPCVKIYNNTYYHSPKNACWIVQGTKQPEDWKLEGMDEWEAVFKICEDVPFKAITDFFLGQGLVAEAAFNAGKVFYGSDMNRNRLAVAINRIAKRGGDWTINK